MRNPMRLALLAGCVLPACALAQVKLEVTLGQDQFLQGESLPVAVRIVNRSGQTLHLGKDEDWLTFSVESHDGFVVSKLGDAPVAGEFTLESSKVATKRVNIGPWFGLSQPGRYEIAARVKLKEWNQEVVSPPREFTIIHGSTLWEREFGVPPQPGESPGAPEMRKYVLQQANYIKGQLRLYLTVMDGSGASVLHVAPVGPIVSLSHPVAQVDKVSNLHILYADGPRSYSYSVFNPNGGVLVRQTYEFTSVRPKLMTTEEGNITLTGGSRRYTANDVPLEEPPQLDEHETNAPVDKK